ncbi:MAG: contractile injection system tape measure protein [Bacteroidota bacterium]
MSYTQQHIIQRQILEVQLASRENHHPIAEEVTRIFEDQISAQLEQLFDRFAPADRMVSLDTLVLDLGQVSLQQLERDLPTLFLQAAEKELQSSFQQNRSSQQQTEEPSLSIAPQQGKIIEALFQYLRSGNLPWWIEVAHMADFEEKVLPALATASPSEWKQVLSRKPARTRLAYQFGEAVFREVVAILQLTDSGISPYTLTTSTILQKAQQGLSPVKREQLLGQLIHGHTEGTELIAEQTAKKIPPANPSLSSTLEQPYHQAGTYNVKRNVHYVSYAGVVLLWPWLGQFFRKLGLMEGKQFQDPAAQQKAIHLLAYLCTGREDVPEYECLLFKLLCDYPFEEVLLYPSALTTKEKTASEALLLALIQHWSKLQNTQPDSLRETFLQREGKLTHKQEGWQLQVEQEAYDILLSQLPWSISAIKLSWMDEMVWVEWG